MNNNVTTIPAIICLRRGTLQEFAEANPILDTGEVGFVIGDADYGRFKVGDGQTPWNSIQEYYISNGQLDNAVSALTTAFNSGDSGVLAALQQETANRITAVINLQGDIANEAAQRQSGDDNLQQAVNFIIGSKGAPDGFAGLNNEGKVPLANLPTSLLTDDGHSHTVSDIENFPTTIARAAGLNDHWGGNSGMVAGHISLALGDNTSYLGSNYSNSYNRLYIRRDNASYSNEVRVFYADTVGDHIHRPLSLGNTSDDFVIANTTSGQSIRPRVNRIGTYSYPIGSYVFAEIIAEQNNSIYTSVALYRRIRAEHQSVEYLENYNTTGSVAMSGSWRILGFQIIATCLNRRLAVCRRVS